MNIVNPNNTSHQLKVIPRYYDYGELVLELYNELTKVTSIVTNLNYPSDGYLFLEFDFDFNENDKFQVKIKDDSTIVYRGKLIATAKNTQNYKASNYYYE